MASQYSSKFHDRDDESGATLGRVSSCLQSFDESHITCDPASLRSRPSYTAQQKDEAIRLLDQGTPVKAITEQIGAPACDKSNPYRWRAELRQRQHARQEWIRAQRDRVVAQAVRVVTLMWLVYFDLLLFLLCLVGDIIAITYFMDYHMRVIWIVGRIGVLILLAQVRVAQFRTVRVFKISVGLFWMYQLYCLGVYLFGVAEEASRF